MKYRNVGAPFRRSDGSLWAQGEVDEPFEAELRWGLVQLRPADEPWTEPPTEPIATAPVSSEEVAPPADDSWNLRMSPERYLQLHPDGKHADKAYELIKAQKEAHERLKVQKESEEVQPDAGAAHE